MRFVDVCFKDKICFIPDAQGRKLNYPCFAQQHEYSDQVLCDFLNLYKQDYKLDATFGNIETFAMKYGSLMNEDWLPSIAVPQGFSCIELENFNSRFAVDKIYYEKIEVWKKHILAFHDLANIAYVKTYQSRLDNANVVKHIFKHIMHYREQDGTYSYLYFGSSDFLDCDRSNFIYYLPPEVKDFLKNIGNIFVFRSKTESQIDSLSSRQAWFAANAKKILNEYEELYIKNCKVSNLNLLGKLQDSLLNLNHDKRPLSMCLICGSFFLPYGEAVVSGHFCSGLCQSRFYQKRETFENGFTQATAFDATDFKRLFNSRNRKW